MELKQPQQPPQKENKFKDFLKQQAAALGISGLANKIADVAEPVLDTAGELIVKDAHAEAEGAGKVWEGAKKVGGALARGAEALPDQVAAGVGSVRTVDAEVKTMLHAPVENTLGRTGSAVKTVWRDRFDQAAGLLFRNKLKDAQQRVTVEQLPVPRLPTPEEESQRRERKGVLVDADTVMDRVIDAKYKAAVAFDGRRQELVVELLTASIAEGPQREVGREVIKTIVATLVSNEDAMQTIAKAGDRLRAMQQIPELSSISSEVLLGVFAEMADKQTEVDALILESRGKSKSTSYEHETGLIERTSEAQQKAQELGWALKDALPENGLDLTHATLADARGKSADFTRATWEVIEPLRELGHSLKARFPEKRRAVTDQIKGVVKEWRKTKTEIRANTKNYVLEAEAIEAAQEGVGRDFILENETLKSANLTPEQRATVLASMGCKENNDKIEPTDKRKKFARLLRANEEVMRLVDLYEQAREQTDKTPEMAGELMFLAEAVVAAKAKLEAVGANFRGDIIIEVREIKNDLLEVNLEARNNQKEYDHAVDRRNRYTEVLKRLKQKLEDEKELIAIWRKRLAIAGVATIVGAGTIAIGAELGQNQAFIQGMSEVWQHVVMAFNALSEALSTGVKESWPEIKNVGEIALVGSGAVFVLKELQKRIHIVTEKSTDRKLSEGELAAAESLKQHLKSMEQLAAKFDQVDAAAAEKLRETIKQMSGAVSN